jgi:hypothetical protein
MQILCRLAYKCAFGALFCSHTPSTHKVNMQTCNTLDADFKRLYADLMQTIIYKCSSDPMFCYHAPSMHMVISLPSFDFCRTYVASKGRLRAGCFQALRRVEKPEDQGQFGRYAPVQYLEKGTVASQDDSFFAWWCQSWQMQWLHCPGQKDWDPQVI